MEKTINKPNLKSILSVTVIVGALGYFVDVYDLILFGIVRVPSLTSLGYSGNQILDYGVLLLNVSPMADGTIPDNQKQVLLDMGKWLDAYGESIYETRPWYTFGEGPTKEPEGHFDNHQEFLKIKYSSKDVRYTSKEDVRAT